MILLIDNYDGCANNLFQMLSEIRNDVRLVHNDQITTDEIRALAPTHIVLSGGGTALDQVGIATEVVRTFQGEIPILGICLGCRIICGVYGGTMCPTKDIMQGKTSQIGLSSGSPLFRGLPKEIRGMRYHSMTIDPASISGDLTVIATAEDDGDIMGVANESLRLYGLQYHLESYFTEYGMEVLRNFLAME